MTQQIFNVGGHQIVFGLDWMPLSGEKSEAKELRDLARETSSAFHVRCVAEHSVMYGFLPKGALPEKTKGRVLVSAAVLLASCPDVTSARAIFIEVDGTIAKLIAIDHGVPVPGGDFVGSVIDAEVLIKRIQTEAGAQFAIYGNHSDVYEHTIQLSLEELLAQDDAKVSAATLKKSPAGLNYPVIFLLLLTLVAVGGYFYWEYVKSVRIAEQVAAQRARKKVDPAIKYWEAVKHALPAAGLPSREGANLFWNGWPGQEVYVGGWKLSAVNCTPDACLYVWDIAGGNNFSLREGLGNHAYQYTLDGQQVKYSLPLARKDSAALSLSDFPTFTNFMVTTGSFAQDMRMIGAKIAFEQPTIFAAAALTDIAAVKSPIRFGKYSIDGNVAILKELLLRLPANTTIGTLDIKIDGVQPTFKMQGNYYVKD